MGTTWNPSDSGRSLLLSAANLAVSDPEWLGLAIDFGASKVWFWNPQTGLWNGAAIGSQNPATGTGGITYSATGTLFPMWSGYSGSGTDAVIANFGASGFLNPLPSGFSSWDALAGSATTWNPSDKSADITLSGSNMTATSNVTPGSTWRSVRATNGLSSGKAYFEVKPTIIDGFDGFLFGLGNASASLSSYAGSTVATAFGWQDQGSVWGITGSPGLYQLTNVAFRSVRATTGHTTGKYYFEVTATAIYFDAGFLIGVMDSTASLSSYAGSDSHGVGYAQGGGGSAQFYYGGVAHSTTSNYGVSDVVGVAVDLTNQKVWFYAPGSSKWNGDVIANQNPATNTGGIDISTFSGAVFPAMSLENFNEDDKATANFGPSGFSNSLPSGFLPWDTVASGTLNADGSASVSWTALAVASGTLNADGAASVSWVGAGQAAGGIALIIGV